jgi:ATP-dependent DNA helicase RecG
MNEANLSPIEFGFGSFFTTIFRRPLQVAVKDAIKVTDKVTIKVTDKVTKNQAKILEEMRKNAYITTNELSIRIGISARKIKSNISKLKEKGLLKRIGSAKSGYWEAIL